MLFSVVMNVATLNWVRKISYIFQCSLKNIGLIINFQKLFLFIIQYRLECIILFHCLKLSTNPVYPGLLFDLYIFDQTYVPKSK